MRIIVKENSPIVIPDSFRRRAGLKAGDRLEFRLSGGIINIIPHVPSAKDEYTPAERMAIDEQLREAEKGPFHGPFETADEAIEFLSREIRKRRPRKAKSPRAK